MICPNGSGLVKMGPNWSKLVTICPIPGDKGIRKVLELLIKDQMIS